MICYKSWDFGPYQIKPIPAPIKTDDGIVMQIYNIFKDGVDIGSLKLCAGDRRGVEQRIFTLEVGL